MSYKEPYIYVRVPYVDSSKEANNETVTAVDPLDKSFKRFSFRENSI